MSGSCRKASRAFTMDEAAELGHCTKVQWPCLRLPDTLLTAMSPDHAIIHLIDDDDGVRRALGRVMTQAGLVWKAHDSAEAFLAEPGPAAGGCIVADLMMPGMSGLELKRRLDSAGVRLPLILLSAHDTITARAAARRAGAAAYFRKPVDIEALLDAIQWSALPA